VSLTRFMVYNLSLPAFDLAKGLSVRREYERLTRIVAGSRESVLAMQARKLRRLVAHAAKHVSYYRDLFAKHGIAPENVKSVEDLACLPVLRRDNIQEHAAEMVSETADKARFYKGSSSGSTGVPVTYLRDRAGSSASQAAMYFGWSLSGWCFGMPYLTIWGNVTTVNKDWARPSSKIKSWLFRETKIPAFSLTERKKFDELHETCRTGRFAYIQGYTNAIHAFASHLIDRDLSLPGIQGVLTTAENLQEHQRAAIQQALGPVFDFYGCGEINAVAFQCRQGNYHVMDPHVVLEYGERADDQGNHELYITDLDNYGMPLIRYANDDMGKPGPEEPCACGLPLGILGNVSGRTSDIIRTPEGGILSVPSFLGNGLLQQLTNLVRYRVDVVAQDELVVNLQARGSMDAREEELIRQSLKDYIPRSMNWSIRLVDEIKPEANGKYKLIVDKTQEQTQ
jgi:phenylacetate-CoA ligase